MASDNAALLNARAALDVVERFRECRNLLHAFRANLSALESITQQKLLLEGAVRRQQQGGEAHGEQRGDAAAAARCSFRVAGGSHASSASEHVATAPLGVLSAFSPALAERLVGQHQQDQGQLLRALGNTAQVWRQKTSTVAQLVAALDGGGEDGEGSSRQPGSLTTAGPSGGARNQAALRKAKLKEAAEALYGGGGAAAATSVPVAGGTAPSSSSPSQTRNDVYVSATGLTSLTQVQHAAHGVLSALTKMGSILQECVLALRADLLNTSCDGGRSASLLRELLSREAEEGSCGREMGSCFSAVSAHERKERSDGSGRGGGSLLFGGRGDASALSAGKATEPLSFLDALTALRAALDALWEQSCQERFLHEDALILLAG